MKKFLFLFYNFFSISAPLFAYELINVQATGGTSGGVTPFKIEKFNPNFIFVNGALHHLDDKTVSSINKLSKLYNNSYFLSVDPVRSKNKFLNKIMISLDRGKYIREHSDYSNLMDSCESVIIDDFYRMSFKQIFHFKNLDINDFYKEWKSSVLK